MKILFLNQQVSSGSTGKIVTDIANNIMQNGDNEVKCIHGFFPNIEKGCSLFPGECIQTVSKFQYYRYNALAKLLGKSGFLGKKETEKALEKLGNWVPDIVHLHNLHGYCYHLPTLFSYLQKIDKPVIWTLHDCWPVTGHCPYFDQSNCFKWQNGCTSPCPEKSSYPKGILSCPVERNFKKKAKLYSLIKNNLTFVAPSKWLADIAEISPIIKCPSLVIHNGIDLTSFKPTNQSFRNANNLENKTVILGVASPWASRKGLGEFIKLAKDLPGSFQLVMVGVDEKLSPNLPNNIIKIARTESKEELADIYSSADLFVTPAYADNYPTVCLEAQACGTPVLAYDAGGTKETLLEGYSSFVSKGDYDSLLKAIVNFTPKRIPPNLAQVFSYQRMAVEYANLYKDCIRQKAYQKNIAPPRRDKGRLKGTVLGIPVHAFIARPIFNA